MAVSVDASKLERALLRAANDAAEKRLGAAAFKKPFSDGLRDAILGGGGNWKPNSEGWAERKRRLGFGSKPWVRTGATLAAVSNNAPGPELKTQGRVRFGLNRRGGFAFAQPRAFTDSRGRKRLPAKEQEKVLTSLKRGSAIARLKKSADRQGRGIMDVLSGVMGPTRRDRARAAGGFSGVPARPLLFWRREWRGVVERDVDEAVKAILRAEGLSIR